MCCADRAPSQVVGNDLETKLETIRQLVEQYPRVRLCLFVAVSFSLLIYALFFLHTVSTSPCRGVMASVDWRLLRSLNNHHHACMHACCLLFLQDTDAWCCRGQVMRLWGGPILPYIQVHHPDTIEVDPFRLFSHCPSVPRLASVSTP